MAAPKMTAPAGTTDTDAGAAGAFPAAVIFDLDGTLVDSAPDIQEALNAAFAPLTVPSFDLVTAKKMIGGGVDVALQRAQTHAGLDVSKIDQNALKARFMAVYLQASRAGRGLFPGAHDLLTALRRRGVRLAICTNKAQEVTNAAVTALRIGDYFEIIIGGRDGVPKKPDPTVLLEALKFMGAGPHDAVMVGDSSADAGAAKAAGLPFVAMSYGYTPHPHELGADLVVDQLSQVPAALNAITVAVRSES